MHELSIAESILSTVRKTLDAHPGVRPVRVRVKVGALAGVDVEALRFCFEIAVDGTEWRGLKLDTCVIPGRVRCLECGHTMQVESTVLDCARCGSVQTVMSGSDELDIDSVEVERDGNNHSEAEGAEREPEDCRRAVRAV